MFSSYIIITLIIFTGLTTVLLYKRRDNSKPSNKGLSNHISNLKYTQVDGGKMAYIDEGEGPVILLLHGVPTSSWLYRNIYPTLIKKGFRVICPDMLGFGHSDKPKDPMEYTHDKMGNRLLQLMEKVKVERWTQVFHDSGGLWTWEMLKIDTSKVNHLIMLNTIVYQEGFLPPIKFWEGKVAHTYANQYTTNFGQSIVINPTFKNGVSHKEIINRNILEGYKTPLLNQSPSALYYFFTRTCNKIPDYETLHQSLDIPTTIIWGIDDDMLVYEKIKNKLIKNFNLSDGDIYLLDAKHFIQEEKPEQISSIIIGVLK